MKKVMTSKKARLTLFNTILCIIAMNAFIVHKAVSGHFWMNGLVFASSNIFALLLFSLFLYFGGRISFVFGKLIYQKTAEMHRSISISIAAISAILVLFVLSGAAIIMSIITVQVFGLNPTQGYIP